MKCPQSSAGKDDINPFAVMADDQIKKDVCNMAKAIIFDMDGVLADSEPLHVRAETSILEKQGIRLSEKEWAGYKGVTEKFFWTDLNSKYKLGKDHLALAAEKRDAF